jgi:adenylate kinase family enzyme
VVIEIVKKHLKEIKKENKNIILEGYPKTMAQALSL